MALSRTEERLPKANMETISVAGAMANQDSRDGDGWICRWLDFSRIQWEIHYLGHLSCCFWFLINL